MDTSVCVFSVNGDFIPQHEYTQKVLKQTVCLFYVHYTLNTSVPEQMLNPEFAPTLIIPKSCWWVNGRM